MKQGQAIITISHKRVRLEDVAETACSRAIVNLSNERSFRDRLARSRETLLAHIESGRPVYGVTTGFGSSCGNRPREADMERLGDNLIRFHGCGTGEPLAVEQSRASVLCRLICLAKGFSGVSPELLQALADLLNHGITPVIPAEGSVGASGDLTPMSYVAACLAGDREVIYQGRRMPAAEALAQEGLMPYRFRPKEPLGIMNGTSVMTGIAALVIVRARRVLAAAEAATALVVHALMGHDHHFHSTIFVAKPFRGMAAVAERLRGFLEAEGDVEDSDEPGHFQDPYSVRCAPHVLGVLKDALDWIGPWVETEINSANDNPLADPESGRVLMGGNFYGGHVSFAMDSLKTALANLCDLCDRQVALLVDPRMSRGLPNNLAFGEGPETQFHHGYKAMQITASALTAEALKLCMPASVFSRSTESHNQDKVSMGTISARDAERVCTLSERVTAIGLMAGVRACRLRKNTRMRPRLFRARECVERYTPQWEGDRPMDAEVEVLARAIRDGEMML